MRSLSALLTASYPVRDLTDRELVCRRVVLSSGQRFGHQLREGCLSRRRLFLDRPTTNCWRLPRRPNYRRPRHLG